MWQIMAQMAIDIANERAREARQEQLASSARATREAEARAHGLARPSRVRTAAASVLRSVSGAAGSVSEAACDAATRLERRTA